MTNEERTKMIIAHNERIKRELNDTCRNKISSMKCSGIDGVLAGLSFCGAANIDFSYNVLAKIGVFLLSGLGAFFTVSAIQNLINYSGNNDRINYLNSRIYHDDDEIFKENSKEEPCK